MRPELESIKDETAGLLLDLGVYGSGSTRFLRVAEDIVSGGYQLVSTDELRKLRAAVQPFANFARAFDREGHKYAEEFYTIDHTGEPMTITISDFRAARDAIGAPESQP